MKILLLCYEYPPIGGGGGVGAKQYAEAWALKGHAVTVLTSWHKALSFAENVNSVTVIRVFTIGKKNRATATFVSMFSYIVFGFLYILLHKCRLNDADVINTHFSIPTGPLGWLASKILKIPNILTIIGGDIYDPSKKSSPHSSSILRSINRNIMNSAEAIVAISSDTKNRAMQYYHVTKDIHVINYGFTSITPSKGDRDTISRVDGKYYLITVGRLIKRKGFEYLILSMTILPQNVLLRIIGDGPMEAPLKKLALENNLWDRVQFLGFKSREKIYEYLVNSDCYVLPSLHEGLALVVQEAMSAGLPIVATDNGGQVDLIQDGRNGILVKPLNVKMLADAIETIYQNKNLARQMRENNNNDIKNYDISIKAGEYMKLFGKVKAEVDGSIGNPGPV